MGVRLARGDDADDFALAFVTVNYNKKAEALAQAEKDEPIFLLGVVGVVDQQRVFIRKDGLSILEGDTVLSKIQCGLLGILLEA